MAKHLTDAEITDYFLGEALPTDAAAHLAVCEVCMREVGLTQASVSGFNELGATWAATESVRSVPVPSRFVLQTGIKHGLAWGLAAIAASVLAAVGLPGLRHHPGKLASSSWSGPSAAEVQQDNQWMAAMDRDLRYGPDSISVAADVLQPATLHAKKQAARAIAD